MQIQVRVKKLVRASRLRVIATNKLNVTLAPFSHAIQEVTMHMHDINGPDRGGAGKLCRVVLRLKDNSILVIEDLGVNIIEVIDRVADRLHHTVAKQLARLVKVERTGIRQGNLAAAMI